MNDTPTEFDRDDSANDASQIPAGSDTSVGPSKSSQRLDRAKTLALAMDGISLAPMVWALFSPASNPLLILLLSIIPLIAITFVVRSKGLYQIAGMRGDDRPGLSACFVGCGVALFYRGLRDIDIYPTSWITIVGCAVLVGSILTLMVVRADAKTRDGSWVLILVVASVFAYGAIAEADVLLDWSTPTTTEVLVFSKQVSRRRGGTSWSLHVDKWGPFAVPNDVSVPGSFYRCVAAGQTVCIKIYAGALDIRWYEVATCK